MSFIWFCAMLWISIIPELAGEASGIGPMIAAEGNQIKKQIPVLCYHNIKPLKKGALPGYSITAEEFSSHIQMLSDSGYTTILPGQLYEYIKTGKTLPAKPIMISFDDNHYEHYKTAAPALERVGYKGVFFIMAVTIGKPTYMTSAQIKGLSDRGHVIAGHTWDHPNLKKLEEKEWDRQISQPKKQLEKITGRPIQYFAYPYGAWNERAIVELRKRGIKGAFQLFGKQSEAEPVYTVRRMMVPGNWSAKTLYKNINMAFK